MEVEHRNLPSLEEAPTSHNTTMEILHFRKRRHGYQCPWNFFQLATGLIFIANICSFLSITFSFMGVSEETAIILAFVLGVLVLAAVVSGHMVMIKETEDFLIWEQERSKDFDTSGLEYFCTICQAYVHQGSKHCKRCNKCVYKFDHHCRWLNSCVGSPNYRWFAIFIVSTDLALLLHIVLEYISIRILLD